MIDEKLHEHIPGEEKFVETEKEKKKVDVWRYKPYICKVKEIDIFTGKRIIVLNHDEAKEHDIYSGFRALLKHRNKKLVVIVDVSEELVKEGEVGLFRDVVKELKMKKGEKVEIIHMERPASVDYIKKKLDKGVLNREQVATIVDEIMAGKLSEIETSAWISAAYINGLSDDEIISLTDATVESGEQLVLKKSPITDKHCIGGVAGNRTTMVIVPIVAAAGLYIPKTSSRAITSASGTADTMEVLADVNFRIDELKSIVTKAKGAIVWGGGMKLAPVDDKLIRVRHPLKLDPEGMLLASILAKKKSVGAQHLIIDIPVGRSAKITDMDGAHKLARHFIKIGKDLGMNVEALITDGSEPVGNGIGPGLECRDVLEVLEGRGPEDLRHKSCLMAGKIFELCGKANKGEGYSAAENLVDTGKALSSMKKIIELQGGDSKITSRNVPIGHYSYDVEADRSGKIFHIDNKAIAKIARIAGAPKDKGAGVYLYRIRGDRVEKGDKLFTIFADSEAKLSFAIKAMEHLETVEMRRMLLDTLRE